MGRHLFDCPKLPLPHLLFAWHQFLPTTIHKLESVQHYHHKKRTPFSWMSRTTLLHFLRRVPSFLQTHKPSILAPSFDYSRSLLVSPKCDKCSVTQFTDAISSLMKEVIDICWGCLFDVFCLRQHCVDNGFCYQAGCIQPKTQSSRALPSTLENNCLVQPKLFINVHM